MREVPYLYETELFSELAGTFMYWWARSPNGALMNDVGNELKRYRKMSLRPITPRSAPAVERWLNDDLAIPDFSPIDKLCQKIIQAKDLLDWRTLAADYAGQQMADDYAYTILIGPDYEGAPNSLYQSETVMAGVSLQGPGVFYASHWHPAIEFYGVLNVNDGEWQLGDGPFERQPAGTLIHHASMMPHAMRTHNDPMLTVFAWTGDLYTFPVVG